MEKRHKVVCIGGGHGLSVLLSGLRKYNLNLTAIVTVTDSGRSTGIIRKEFDIIAPGDIRNCLISLSRSPQLMNDLLQYRFDTKSKDGQLQGMSVGNLLLTALTKITGNFDKAVAELGKILKIDGRVLPTTLDNTHICAKLKDKTIVEEEFHVRGLNKKPIKEIFLKNEAEAYSESVKEILSADVIVFGPGGLYTSILVNLLVNGISDAIAKSHAVTVYAANIMTQPGVTEHLDGLGHIKEVIKYASPGKLDYVILNEKKPPAKVLKRYESAGAKYLYFDQKKIEQLGVKCIYADLADLFRSDDEEWARMDYIRHSSEKLALQVTKLVRPHVKGVLLVAGKGERLKPFSLKRSKELLSFVGKPLLAHQLDEFIENNIRDIVIICNKDNYQEIKTYFSEHYKDIHFEFVIQYDMKGPANALNYARKYLEQSYFLVKYGDSVTRENQVKNVLSKFFENSSVDGVLTLRKVNNPSEYGIVRFGKNKNVLEIVEKPIGKAPSHFATVGLFIMNGEKFFSAVDEIGVEEVLFPADYLLRKKCTVSSWVMKDDRIDVGRVWNILEASQFFIEKSLKYGNPLINSSKIHPSAIIEDDVYIGPQAVIGKNTVIKRYSSVNGIVGDHSIIDNCVIMDDVSIGSDCLLRNSVIGDNSIIGDGFKTKVAKSSVEIYVKDKYVNPRVKELGLFCGSDVIIDSHLESESGKMVFPHKHVTESIRKDLLTRLILFDADNTLYKTRGIAKKADIKAMQYLSKILKQKKLPFQSSLELYDIFQKIVAKVITSTNPQRRERTYSYQKLSDSIDLSDYGDKAYAVFYKEIIDTITLFPHIKKLLRSLDKYNLMVFSEDSREKLHDKLKQCNILNYFDTVVSSEDVGHMKASADYYKKLFTHYNLIPSECIVVGDSYERDLKIPKSIGCMVVLFDPESKNTHYYKKVDSVISDHNELLKIIKTN